MPNAWSPKEFQSGRGLQHTPMNFENATGIVRQVKWVTKKDERVCPICGQLEGKVFPENMRPKIPVHTGCRCELYTVQLESRVIAGEVEVGSQLDLYNRTMARLDGFAVKHNLKTDTDYFIGETGTETATVKTSEKRSPKDKSLVRTGSITGIYRAFTRYKNMIIRMAGMTPDTQEQQGMKFGSNGRRFVTSGSVLSHRGRRLKPQVEDTDNEQSNEKEQTRDFVRSGILMEIAKFIGNMIYGD